MPGSRSSPPRIGQACPGLRATAFSPPGNSRPYSGSRCPRSRPAGRARRRPPRARPTQPARPNWAARPGARRARAAAVRGQRPCRARHRREFHSSPGQISRRILPVVVRVGDGRGHYRWFLSRWVARPLTQRRVNRRRVLGRPAHPLPVPAPGRTRVSDGTRPRTRECCPRWAGSGRRCRTVR